MALPSKKRKVFDGRYEVLQIVGRGSESVVYHAKHIASPSVEVALKVLLSQKDNRSVSDRLRKEALTLVSCRHRYVVRLDDFHSIEGLCYLALEYAPEGDLRKYQTKLGGKIPFEQAERFLLQCLEGLDFVHATGVIHRDMKPDNILVMNEQEIRIADFGLALLPGDEPSLTELQAGVGSFNYLPPEVLEGIRYDQRSDLYSLGLCFYELVSGTHPFENASLAGQMDARKDEKIADIRAVAPGIPERLAAVIMKLIRFDAKERFDSAAEAERGLRDSGFTFDPTDFLGGASTGEADFSDYEPAPAFTAPDSDAGATEPTNIDQPEAPPQISERIPQPTEKIDLERIKEIVAREEKRQQEIADRKSRRESAVKDSESSGNAALAIEESLPDSHSTAQAQTTPSSRPIREQAPQSNPLLTKFIYTVVGTALALVMGLKLLSSFSSDDSPEESPTAQIESGTEQPAVIESTVENEIDFSAIPAGRYSGEIEGVIPGVTSPMVVLSLPSRGQVAVIVGIEGWKPVLASTANKSSIVVNSNGVVLRLEGTESGGQFKGTFVNSINQNTGTFKFKESKRE
jgi:serine/threonine protein kinase